MMVDTNKESLNINKLVCEKEEIINVEEDMIVPDSKPDILSTISTSGNICVYKKELMNEKMKIDGNINAYVMYIAESSQDNVRGINVNLDFSKMFDAPNCNEDMILDVITEIKNIECNVINGRKINVKAQVGIKFKVYTNETVEMINEILNNDDIQVLRKDVKVNSLVGCGNTKAYVKDTIMIDNTDNLAEILNVNINMVDKDIKTSYNKIIAKTEAEIKAMYLTEDNRIVTCSNKIPIVGFIDIPNVSEENICDANFEIRNMIIKPNNVEEHSIYVELEIEVSCMAYEEKEINLLEDLYSPTQNLECSKKGCKIFANKQNRRETCHIKETVNLPELTEKQLIDAECKPKIINTNKLNSRIMYEGELELNFIIGSLDTQVNSARSVVPFEFTVDNIENGEALNIETELEVGAQDYMIKSGGDVAVDVDTIFNIGTSENVDMKVIDNIEVKEDRNDEDYSLVIYIVKPGDTLWNIAKKIGSTVTDIVKANAIENENIINVGEKLYIPKYRKTSAKEQANMPTMMNYA